jgi:hypothetical protein
MENNQLQLNFNALTFLKSAAKWASFLAIIGFITAMALLVAAVFMGVVISDELANEGGISHQNGIISAVLGLTALLYFFPVYYLFRFAFNTKSAIKYNNNEMIANAFGYLKSHFKFIGIMTILMLLIYIVAGVGLVVFGHNSLGR